MSAELLSSISGIVLSLIFSYIPGVKRWFDTLESEQKQLFMGLLLILVSSVIFLLSCYEVLDYVTCDKTGLLGLLNNLIYALVANQSIYQLTKEKKYG
jgi:hypothetical protein